MLSCLQYSSVSSSTSVPVCPEEVLYCSAPVSVLHHSVPVCPKKSAALQCSSMSRECAAPVFSVSRKSAAPVFQCVQRKCCTNVPVCPDTGAALFLDTLNHWCSTFSGYTGTLVQHTPWTPAALWCSTFTGHTGTLWCSILSGHTGTLVQHFLWTHWNTGAALFLDTLEHCGAAHSLEHCSAALPLDILEHWWSWTHWNTVGRTTSFCSLTDHYKWWFIINLEAKNNVQLHSWYRIGIWCHPIAGELGINIIALLKTIEEIR